MPQSLRSYPIRYYSPKWRELLSESFVAIDVETTGLFAKYDRVVEVCALRYEKCVLQERFATLVNPGRKVKPDAAAVNNISDEMVKGAPFFKDIADQLLSVIGESAVVCHNAPFDISFLEAEFDRAGRFFICMYADSLDAAKRLFPSLASHRLQSVLNHIGHARPADHRAEADCEGCAAIVRYALGQKI
jgi:DNA polymerase III epsilon subunit family exonuclease